MNNTESTGDDFNEYQRRALSVTLRTVEQSLLSMLQKIGKEDYSATLNEWKNNIPLGQRKNICQKIVLIQEMIKNISERYSLEKTVQFADQQFAAQLSHNWVILQDIKSKKLARYGVVAPSLQKNLDIQIDEMIAIIADMQNILNGKM